VTANLSSELLCVLLAPIWSVDEHLFSPTDINCQMVKALLGAGAAVNAKTKVQNTPLHLCYDKPEMAEILLEAGALVEAANKWQKTPLDLCSATHNAATGPVGKVKVGCVIVGLGGGGKVTWKLRGWDERRACRLAFPAVLTSLTFSMWAGCRRVAATSAHAGYCAAYMLPR